MKRTDCGEQFDFHIYGKTYFSEHVEVSRDLEGPLLSDGLSSCGVTAKYLRCEVSKADRLYSEIIPPVPSSSSDSSPNTANRSDLGGPAAFEQKSHKTRISLSVQILARAGG